MSGDEKSNGFGQRCTREGKFRNHFACARQQNASHPFMSSDRFAVIDSLGSTRLDAPGLVLGVSLKAERLGNNLFTEVTLTDKQRHQENSRSRKIGQDLRDTWFLLPE